MREWSNLPPAWAVAPLELLAEINPRPVAVPESDASPVHFVPMRAVIEEFGGIDVSERRSFGEVRKGYTAFQAEDVLFAKITPCMENGKLALVPDLQDGIGFGSTEFHVMRARAGMAPKWLAHFLSQAEFRKFARRNMTGTAGQLRVATPWLSATSLPVAPAAEQIRIVDKLEELLSDLDAGVAKLKAAQKKLAQYRQSLLKSAVEGRLTEAWRAQHGEPVENGAQLLARILGERRARWEAKQLAKFESQGKTPTKGWQNRYPEPLPPDAGALGELPDGWAWASVDQCSLDDEAITDGPFGSNLKSAHYTTNGPRVIRLQNIGDGIFVDARAHISEAHFASLQKHSVLAGDIVIAMLGEVLPRACLVPEGIAPAIVKADCARVRANLGLISSTLLASFLGSNPTRKRVTGLVKGIGRPRVNLGGLRSIPIPIPSRDEQVQIEAALAACAVSMGEQLDAIELALKQSAAQRKNILQAAFSGHLVPQDPNDEPASVLLARIRAERAASGIPTKARGRKKKETS